MSPGIGTQITPLECRIVKAISSGVALEAAKMMSPSFSRSSSSTTTTALPAAMSAIARSTEKCLSLGAPLVAVVIGEGGSGGAVAFATADRVAMLEHSIYSVISPEGCASILWKDAEKMREAAEAQRLTAQDLKALGVIDRVIPEPRGGAQRDPAEAIRRVGAALGELLAEVEGKKPDALRKARRRKYLEMGSKSLVA